MDESVFEQYRDGFAAFYGDRVYVYVSGPMVLDDFTDNDTGSLTSGTATQIVPIDLSVALSGSAFLAAGSNGNAPEINFLPWAIASVCLFGTLLIAYRLRVQQITAKQTTNGLIITGSGAVSRSEVVRAVKSAGITPRDEVFSAIKGRIQSQ